MRLRSCLLVALASVSVEAAAQTPITLDQAMAHPDWIGPPVESAWWTWDGRSVLYQAKRSGSPVRDTWLQPVDGGAATRVEDGQRAGLDAAAPVYDATHSRMLFVRNGDVFERDLRSGALVQVTRSAQEESAPQYAADDGGSFNRARVPLGLATTCGSAQ